jgi:hypothetical protein
MTVVCADATDNATDAGKTAAAIIPTTRVFITRLIFDRPSTPQGWQVAIKFGLNRRSTALISVNAA